MPELFSNSVFLLIANLIILAVMIIASLFILSRLRSYPIQKEQSELSPEKHLNYFQELKRQGKLSDEEFRFIKKRLSIRIAEGQRSEDGIITSVLNSGILDSKIDPAVILDRLAVERWNAADTENEIDGDETQFSRKDNGDTVTEKKIL